MPTLTTAEPLVIGVIDSLGDGGGTIVHGLGRKDTLLGSSGHDFLYGGAGNDRLIGQAGADRLFGGKHSDRLFGGRGHDRLFGGRGKDVLFGWSGNDRLIGGYGRDVLHGGAGADQFVFKVRERGIDTIADFSSTEGDSLYIKGESFGITSTDELMYSASTGALSVKSTNVQIAVLKNMSSVLSLSTDVVIF